MIEIHLIVALIFLIVISVIDLRTHKVPSIITTMFIIGELLLVGEKGLYFMAILFLFGWLMDEYGWISGGADLKVITAIGVIIPSIEVFMWFILLFLIVGVLYKVVYKQMYPNHKQVAFTPVFFWIFMALLIGGAL